MAGAVEDGDEDGPLTVGAGDVDVCLLGPAVGALLVEAGDEVRTEGDGSGVDGLLVVGAGAGRWFAAGLLGSGRMRK